MVERQKKNKKIIILVVVILCILFSAALVLVLSGVFVVNSVIEQEQKSAQVMSTRIKLLKLEHKIQEYRIIQIPFALPHKLDDLVKPPNGEPAYIQADQLKDSWGEKIVYKQTDDSFVLMSKGPDKPQGTDDDITASD